MVFTRPVTANEQLYLAGKRHFSDVVIQVVVEGIGYISTADLQDALIRVSYQFPGTCLRLEKKQWIADGPPPPVISMNKYPDISQQFNQLVGMHDGFSPEQGHTCEVGLAQQENHCLLIFRALHGVMDGGGMTLWINAVFQALRGEAIPCANSPLADDTYIQQQCAPIRSEEPIFPSSVGPTVSSEPTLNQEPTLSQNSVFNQEHSFNSDINRCCSFDYARRILCSITPGIVAKLSVGIQQLLIKKEKDTGCIMVPVDIRQSIPNSDRQIADEQDFLIKSTANLSLPLFIPLKKGQHWTQLSALMLNKLDDKQFIARGRSDWVYRTMPKMTISWALQKLWKYQIKKGKYLASAVVSHTGRQNLSDLSLTTFQAESIVFIPCVIPVAPLSLVVTEICTPDGTFTTEVCLVKGQALWSSPQDVLDKLIQLSGLDHLIKKIPTTTYLSPVQFNPVTYPEAHLGLHQLFERQVLVHADQSCLVLGNESLQYEEVNKQANRLARYLQSKGVNNGTFVGVGLERSFEMIIAILAVLKAGGVYLPLDPSMPKARLDYMIADSKVQRVIVLTSNIVHFARMDALIVLDKIAEEIAGLEDGNLDLPITVDDLCYMIYTSGSTGHPKGAMNRHGALTNHFLWMLENFNLGVSDTTLQKTPISFDASLLEIFLPLLCGAKIIVTKPEGHKDAQYLLSEIEKHQVTFISVVPSVLNILLDEVQTEANNNLRLFLVGGEELSTILYQKIKQYFPNAFIHNLYGPAEAAIDVMTFNCEQSFSGSTVPIGKVIANMEAYVVNSNLQQVEPGNCGELIIAGIGMGPGYYNRPELTTEKFIKHPFKRIMI